MEKWPVVRILGNTSLPGRESFGASRIMLFRCSFFAIIPTGLSADRVATCRQRTEVQVWRLPLRGAPIGVCQAECSFWSISVHAQTDKVRKRLSVNNSVSHLS